MGRYYSGDIEGKFWFGVQSSDDASFFGGEECEPSEINYYFEKGDLPTIKKGLNECKKQLGEYKKQIDEFFKDKPSYNDKQLSEYLKTTEIETEKLLKWYARQELGEKILKCVEEEDKCSFSAEL
jgi:hypothetical protein